MGQTLTHGIYLPDEGERNCYNGLAGNWSILDGAVGTVAEHTSALAGKAPAVHTHTKSDITDFPVYGTTAGTICEGNDSRLSDARTPVAHTHTKSDVTDLLNSNFIPSANNSYNLGSSSYQWNNLYAKNYFYNGVAWGLDKANIWSGWNQFNNLSLYSNDVTYNQAPSSNIELPSIRITGGGRYCGAFDYVWRSTGENVIRLSLGSYRSDGSFGYWACNFGVPRDFSNGGKFGTPAFYPNTDGYNLGDSTHRWKTLNGINPGALSLPSENASSVNLDPTNWVTDGSNYNSYTPPSDGWLAIQVHSADITDLTGQYVFVGRATGGTDYWPQGGLGVLKMVDDHNAKLIGQIFIPVISGKNYHITIKINKTQTEGSIIYARFYPCQGNV